MIFWIIFLCGCLWGAPIFSNAQPAKVYFQRYQTKDGLADTNVHDILQDDRGFLWFAANNGLSRFDGYTFTNFRRKNDDPQSISDNFVYKLFQDSKKRFWIATRNGLNYYNPETQTFRAFFHDPDNPNSINSNEVKCITEDSEGFLWFGTSRGAAQFDPSKETFQRFVHDPNQPDSLSHNDVVALWFDSRNTLWIGTVGGGLNRYDPATNRFIRYQHEKDNSSSIKSNDCITLTENTKGELLVSTWDLGIQILDRDQGTFRSIPQFENIRVTRYLEDRQGKIWVSAWDDGLYCLDPSNGALHHFLNDNSDPGSLSSNTLDALYEDRSGMIWIGSLYGGVNVIDHRINRFINYAHFIPTASSHMVFCLYEDRESILWLGSYKSGLVRFDRKTSTSEKFTLPNHTNDEFTNSVLSILEDRKGRIWLGGYRSGLYCFDKDKRLFLPILSYIENDKREKDPYLQDSIRNLLQDRDGSLWIATDYNGLLHLDEDGNLIQRYLPNSDDSNSLSHKAVTCLFQDADGILWIGTDDGGLNRFDPESQHFVHYRNEPANPQSLSHNRVSCIFYSRSNDLWIGTMDGLNRFDPNTGKFERFYDRDGLPSSKISGLLEDKKGNLWISTNFGISKLNPKSRIFKNYDLNDGLFENEYNSRTVWNNKRGELFFGGMKGFITFFPEKIGDNRHTPPIEITNFEAMGKTVPTEKWSNSQKTLILSYEDKYFSFEFAALDFTNTRKNQYAYRLEGFDSDWIYCGTRRFANYTNLNPGHYTLRVKGSNNDGYWNETGASLQIIVTPPFWTTWWFRAFVVVGIGILVSFWFWLRVRKYKREQKYLREQVDLRTFELQQKNVELEKILAEREEALKKIKRLSGLIPICASCKKVRSDKGFWNQIEVYISEHSDADFTHSLCPDCAAKMYPDYYKMINPQTPPAEQEPKESL